MLALAVHTIYVMPVPFTLCPHQQHLLFAPQRGNNDNFNTEKKRALIISVFQILHSQNLERRCLVASLGETGLSCLLRVTFKHEQVTTRKMGNRSRVWEDETKAQLFLEQQQQKKSCCHERCWSTHEVIVAAPPPLFFSLNSFIEICRGLWR